jgi:hypothetical protein
MSAQRIKEERPMALYCALGSLRNRGKFIAEEEHQKKEEE